MGEELRSEDLWNEREKKSRYNFSNVRGGWFKNSSGSDAFKNNIRVKENHVRKRSEKRTRRGIKGRGGNPLKEGAGKRTSQVRGK